MSLQDLLITTLSNMHPDANMRTAVQNILNNTPNVPQGGSWQPNIDIVDSKNLLTVYMELPGVDEKSINVEFFNNKLTVSGNKLKQWTGQPWKKEIRYGTFRRNLVLPMSVTSQENVTVKYTDGILILSVNKQNERQNRFCVQVHNGIENIVDQER